MQGEILAIMGPSGCGKTTLLNLLGGLDRPTSGLVIAGDRMLTSMSDAELTRLRLTEVGFIFQAYNLIPTLTAIENVELPLSLLGISKRERFARASWLLTLVGLVGKEHRLPSELSGGEQQRVAIARALANNPRVILADEPTGNLDSSSSAGILKTFSDLNEEFGQTLVVVTHDSRVAASATRVIQMVDGHIVEDCPSGGNDPESCLRAHAEKPTKQQIAVAIRMLDGQMVQDQSQLMRETSMNGQAASEISAEHHVYDPEDWAAYLSSLRTWLQLRNEIHERRFGHTCPGA